MERVHDNVRGVVVQEDKLSSLPNNLIHKILSFFDIKFVVQTCLLSSRWKLLWTSMPYLNFSTDRFPNLQKFDEFVTHVLSRRNHQSEVTSVKLDFGRAENLGFLKNIASYALSHNVQYLTIDGTTPRRDDCPTCLFSSQSLKQFTLSCRFYPHPNTTITSLDFPALTTLNLAHIEVSGDHFSKCVNLKNLTLECFEVMGREKVFDIITPRLSNLTLIDGKCIINKFIINVIAPQLENLTVIRCEIKYFNAPLGLSSFCYRSIVLWDFYDALEFSNDPFHSLNKVTIGLYFSWCLYTKEHALKIISMLQKLHSARHVTLDWEVVECISSFPDLLSHLPSPFSNLICLTIDCSRRNNAGYKVKFSTEAKNFFLENSPNAKFIMEVPEIHLLIVEPFDHSIDHTATILRQNFTRIRLHPLAMTIKAIAAVNSIIAAIALVTTNDHVATNWHTSMVSALATNWHISCSDRWKLLWTSMPHLNFSTDRFPDLQKFDEFAAHVLSDCNHQLEVSSVKLHFKRAENLGFFLKNIASYAFSHNVQNLTIDGTTPSKDDYPPCLFSSRSLKQFTLSFEFYQHRSTTITSLNFPALTTLNLTHIYLCGDVFSTCVNLKNLTLKCFWVEGPEKAFDIITPRLSNLTLIDDDYISKSTVNVIAPQLENLTIIRCNIKYINAPPGLSSFCYRSRSWLIGVPQFTNDPFHSLNKVTIGLYFSWSPYTKEHARKTISMLQKLHSARHVRLDWEVAECISSFPNLLSHHPSPFCNLICLTIDYSRRNNVAYEVKISTEAKNFFLGNSPNATFIMEVPEVHLSE
ncbi:hypothetical protein LXL04_025893 [Taraxacum kok-saghyz]